MSVFRRLTATAAFVFVGSLAIAPAASAISAAPTVSAIEAAAKVVGPTGVAGCQLLPDPKFPLELGTAVAAGMFKTVAMEKELFSCQSAAAGSKTLRDLETFIEVVESPAGKLLSMTVSLAICDRLFPAGSLKCSFQAIPLGSATANPLEGCAIDAVNFANDPVEMNVVASGRNVKTIKLDKEWYRCPQGVVELYQFTEIFENAVTTTGAVNGFKTAFNKVFAVVCRKDVTKGIITGCRKVRIAGG